MGLAFTVTLLVATSEPTTAVEPKLLRWGVDGHQATAMVASSLISNTTRAQVDRILGSGYSMAKASTWADQIKRYPEWKWSSKLHFMDVPEHVCTADYGRDCVNGECVVGAIANFTQQLANPHISSDE